VCFAPDRSTDRVIEIPVEKVTSVMFGGPNLDVLYVTSMAKRPLPRFPGDGVLRGSLFAIYGLGIRGVPESRFAGRFTIRRLENLCCGNGHRGRSWIALSRVGDS
jgi:hypothetical protein